MKLDHTEVQAPKLDFKHPVNTTEPSKNFRPRKQKSGETYYYFDAGGKPRREVPLGSDYQLAVKRYWYLNGVATGYEALPPAFHLYRHFDRNGVLLYVGISLSAIGRLQDHKHTSPWFWSIAKIDIQRFSTREMCEQAERLAIENENPLFNVRRKDKDKATQAKKIRNQKQVIPA